MPGFEPGLPRVRLMYLQKFSLLLTVTEALSTLCFSNVRIAEKKVRKADKCRDFQSFWIAIPND